nr:phospholipase-like protein [Tanacetum cinerariifolium]
MLSRQHKVDDDQHGMPLIYYIKGHTLHFGHSKFSLITGYYFGTVSFGLHTFGEMKFRNRVFLHKIRLIVTNLDVIGVIEDEESFGKLSDEDAIRLFLLLAFEVIFMGQLLTFNVDDTLSRLVEKLEDWNSFPWGEYLWTYLYDEIKNLKEKHSDDYYYGLKKDRKYTFQVLAHERKDREAKLQFNDEFSSMSFELCDSLNSLFINLIHQQDSEEDIDQDYLLEEELRLCLQEEERLRCEHKKLIVDAKMFRLKEEKMLRLEEENML